MDIPNSAYRCPKDLAVTDLPLRRVMLLGSCLMAGFPGLLNQESYKCDSDFMLINNIALLPENPPYKIKEYDFQVIQIPLRSILTDDDYFRKEYDIVLYEELFEKCCDRISIFLKGAMRWNIDSGLLTFIFNFCLPQQNPMGRLLPRYDLKNPIYFIEELNKHISRETQKYSNCYIYDNDQMVSTFGKKYFQDDMVWQINHNAALTDGEFELDAQRLDGPHKASDSYPLRTHDYIVAAWCELVAMYRTIRQTDQVKLVIVDIDDTLWRGVAADSEDLPHSAFEGWPLGIVEALGYLKRRGILLALVSKNDESRITDLWKRYIGGRLHLEDFSARKINWFPKADNIEEIIRSMNLSPHSVLFVDDNPAERDAVKAAFPDIRVIGSNPLLWRRILLWAPETQVATITSESAGRTKMMHAQIDREKQRQQLSREEFLASRGIKISMLRVEGVSHRSFARVLELINKTNQFNTTGQRWSEEEVRVFLNEGGELFAFEVDDSSTPYGLVVVALVRGIELVQIVMSCRVVGLDVEIAAVSELLETLRKREATEACAPLRETPLNLLSRDLFQRCGFIQNEGGMWSRRTAPRIELPNHITVIKKD